MILCGGAGTRLWPLSRQNFPKHLLPLTGEQTLLQLTAARVVGHPFAPAIIVSGEDQGSLIEQQLLEADVAIEAILLEPMGRNTAAAACLAAEWLHSTDRDELMLLMPSDHVIGDRRAFLDAVAIAARHAEQGAIVTFGAASKEPNTQYGYIEAAADRGFADGAFSIARFHEKPDSAGAAEYVATGRFFWNCGIFLMKASTLLDQMREFLPASFDAIGRSIGSATTDGLFLRPGAEEFARAENISIDNGIMEKTARGVVVPVQMDWSDVGAWDAVWKLGDKDSDGNVTKGEVVAVDTSGSLLRCDGGPLIAALGLDQIAVIAVADAVLVAPLHRMAELKRLVEALKADHGERLVAPPDASKRED